MREAVILIFVDFLAMLSCKQWDASHGEDCGVFCMQERCDDCLVPCREGTIWDLCRE